MIFLKYISDAFQAKYRELEAKKDTKYTDPEDRDEYTASNVFWVPKEARWEVLQAGAKQPTIGKLIDDAMIAIERENHSLKGVLQKDYARPALDKYRLGELIDIMGKIGMGDDADRSKDILGRVYEYFLGRFTDAEIDRIASTYHARRSGRHSGEDRNPEIYTDTPGFCKSATTEEIRSHGYVLTPGRYVGAEEAEDDGEPFAEKMKRLSTQLQQQMAEGRKLDTAILANLKELGYDIYVN